MQWVTPIPNPLTFHQLRHTYVSHLLMAGANPVAVQHMAGHADLKITLETYGHLVPNFMRDEASACALA
ncbi:MAG TPA: tyrosine-type recombinase/integrase [Myxococcales bacterium]|jgi:integrase